MKNVDVEEDFVTEKSGDLVNVDNNEWPLISLDKGRSISCPGVSTGDQKTDPGSYLDAILALKGNHKLKAKHGNTGEKHTKIQGEYTQEKINTHVKNTKQNQQSNYMYSKLREDVNKYKTHQTQKIRPKNLMHRNMSQRNMSQRNLSHRNMSVRRNSNSFEETYADYKDDVFVEETDMSSVPHQRYDRHREHHKRIDSQGYKHTRDQLKKMK